MDSAAAFVFMIATYWSGGSAPIEGGKYLANGQLYNNKEFIAAHRTLPFGTILNVCLRRKCVSVVVKDRGPFLAKILNSNWLKTNKDLNLVAAPLPPGRGPWPLGRVGRKRVAFPDPKSGSGLSSNVHRKFL